VIQISNRIRIGKKDVAKNQRMNPFNTKDEVTNRLAQIDPGDEIWLDVMVLLYQREEDLKGLINKVKSFISKAWLQIVTIVSVGAAAGQWLLENGWITL
jgi:hypothetical protein